MNTRLSLIGIGVVIGCMIGWFLWGAHDRREITPIRQSTFTDHTYLYINPLLALDSEQSKGSIVSTVKEKVESLKKNPEVGDISVYFKELNSSRWFSIYPDTQYNPASLLKVPIMMAYLKYAEQHPDILSEKIYFNAKNNTDQNARENIRSSVAITTGWYTVEDLIHRMIRFSDNNATSLLQDHLNALDFHIFNTPFLDLGVEKLVLNDDFMNITSYALFFRTLYNATYLSRDMSEKALHILTQTDFTDGITRDLPKEVEVAHKFGEFTLADLRTGSVIKREFHNCGIVYDPGHPYFLCIMTSGRNYETLQDIAAQISKMVYLDKKGRTSLR